MAARRLVLLSLFYFTSRLIETQLLAHGKVSIVSLQNMFEIGLVQMDNVHL